MMDSEKRNDNKKFTTISVRKKTLNELEDFKELADVSWDDFFRHYKSVLENKDIKEPLDYWEFVYEGDFDESQ